MGDNIASAFGAVSQTPLGPPGVGADMPLSPQWKFNRANSTEPPKSALIGPPIGTAGGNNWEATRPGWRGPDDKPPGRLVDPKWPSPMDKERPYDNGAPRDRPPATRWREEDREGFRGTDRWGPVPDEPRRWNQDERNAPADRWGDGTGRGRGRLPADDRWGERKGPVGGVPPPDREWERLPGMPAEPELPKRVAGGLDRWDSTRGQEDRWRNPAGGAAGAPGAGAPPAIELNAYPAGRGRGFMAGRGRGLKPGAPAAPGSGVPDRWDGPRDYYGTPPNNQQQQQGQGGTSDRTYSSPKMKQIYDDLLAQSGAQRLPVPRINPDVIREYPEYLADGVPGSRPVGSTPTGDGAAPAGAPQGQAQPPPLGMTGSGMMLITPEAIRRDQWVYKDPQGMTQGPFPRSDIQDWLVAGFFGEDLPIRSAISDAAAPFFPLGNLIKMWDMLDKGRAPPGFAPSAPAPTPAPAPVPEPSQPVQPAQTHPCSGFGGITLAAGIGPSPVTLSSSPSTELGQAQAAMAQATPAQQQQQQMAAPAMAPAAPMGTTQRSASLLETLLGKKLTDSPAQSSAPTSAAAVQGGVQGSDGSNTGLQRPFTLDPPIALSPAGSANLGPGGLAGLGGFDRPHGLPGAAGLPNAFGSPIGAASAAGANSNNAGQSGPGMGLGAPMAWPNPPAGAGPMGGAPGGPLMPGGWPRDTPFPTQPPFDPMRGPGMPPSAGLPGGIWGAAPYRPEGMRPLGAGFGAPGAPSDGSGLGMPPGPLLGGGMLGMPPQDLSKPMGPDASMGMHAGGMPGHRAWGPLPGAQQAGQPLADVQREQAEELARQQQQHMMQQHQQHMLFQHQQQQQHMAQQQASMQQQQQQPPVQALPAADQPSAAPQPAAAKPIHGLPPALQQLFAGAAGKAAAAAVPAPSEPVATPALEPTPPAALPAEATAQSSASASGSSKKKKAPQLVLKEEPKPAAAASTSTAAPALAAPSASSPSSAADDASAQQNGGQPAAPKMAPWAAATVKPATGGLSLREIQEQEAQAAARAAKAQMDAAAAAAAAAPPPVAAAAAAAASPWAKIAAANTAGQAAAAAAAAVAPPPPAPAPAPNAWKPPPAPSAPAPVPALAAAAATNAAAGKPLREIQAEEAKRTPASTAQAPAPVVGTGPGPRGTTLAELLEKQMNPNAGAAAKQAPAWGAGSTKQSAHVPSLRAVMYEESALDLEGGTVDEDLSDVLPMMMQQAASAAKSPVMAAANGGWTASAPAMGPSLREIQQREEQARKPTNGEDESLFWDYGASAPGAKAAPAAAPVAPPAPAAKPAATPQSVAAAARSAAAAVVAGRAAAAAPAAAAAAAPAKPMGGWASAAAANVPAVKTAAPAPVAAAKAAPAAAARPAMTTSAAVHRASAAPTTSMASTSSGEDETAMSPEFAAWARGKMKEFFDSEDLTLVHFLLGVTSRLEVAEYCQVNLAGKAGVSTFVAEFLKRRDADAAARAKGKKAAPKPVPKPQSEWQKAVMGPPGGAGPAKKGGAVGGKGAAGKKVAGITATIPGYSLLNDA